MTSLEDEDYPQISNNIADLTSFSSPFDASAVVIGVIGVIAAIVVIGGLVACCCAAYRWFKQPRREPLLSIPANTPFSGYGAIANYPATPPASAPAGAWGAAGFGGPREQLPVPSRVMNQNEILHQDDYTSAGFAGAVIPKVDSMENTEKMSQTPKPSESAVINYRENLYIDDEASGSSSSRPVASPALLPAAISQPTTAKHETCVQATTIAVQVEDEDGEKQIKKLSLNSYCNTTCSTDAINDAAGSVKVALPQAISPQNSVEKCRAQTEVDEHSQHPPD